MTYQSRAQNLIPQKSTWINSEVMTPFNAQTEFSTGTSPTNHHRNHPKNRIQYQRHGFWDVSSHPWDRRLKSSKLPEQAAASEQKHKEELEMETQKALQVKERRNQVGWVGWGCWEWGRAGKKMENDGDGI